ncbi:MAG: hypothetical protein F6K40_36675 [Okeania sp. SIO3I5]|uniref:hypothetical protein n=1 Tax=Okeania sp. SIO3I5 TaxID=2607805 RepID=UPI0013B5CEA3|nr:hypothetical protein [Okeania sp. SIO3I5]NEQ41437.1 hypothetical protein [Okeania sp. SIO3I5]
MGGVGGVGGVGCVGCVGCVGGVGCVGCVGCVESLVRTGLKKCRVVNILAQTMNEQCQNDRSPKQALPYSLFSRDMKFLYIAYGK